MFDDPEPISIPITDILDLHSISSKDLKPVVQEYLYEANLMGLKALRIIHGRGIGVRRDIVRNLLEKSDLVESFQDAPMEAGGWGATIVTLK